MLELRPHHGLCIQFFCEHGYSEAFTAHMEKTIAMLRQRDPVIRLVFSADCICSCCPHNRSGECETLEKVAEYDRKVLAWCGLTSGTALHWSEFQKMVRKCILDKGALASICGDCTWASICRTHPANET